MKEMMNLLVKVSSYLLKVFVTDFGSDGLNFNSLKDFLGIPVSDTFKETDHILQMQADEILPILN